MKIKNFLLGAVPALLLASCSNDEVMDFRQDEIGFNVNAGAISRASDIYCNNHLPSEFEVFATYQGATYFNGDVIKNQNGSWVNSTGTRYWPDTQTDGVNFFAHHNAGETFSWNNGEPTVNGFTVKRDAAAQEDFVYAVKTGCRKDDNGGQVSLNFRHALSQVVFRAKNTNPNLHVDIEGVTVCNVNDKGDFAFPASSTDAQYGVHNGEGASIDYEDGSWGIWSNLTGKQNFGVTFANVAIPGNGQLHNLTAALNNNDPADKATSMVLLPQTQSAWSGTGKITDATGTYFLVKCRIRNVADAGTGATEEDVYLWGSADEAKDAAIPFDLVWQQGKKYIYTFVFGNGNGGIDPDPDDPDNPVLIPISYTVTVDDFIPGSEHDVEMNTNGISGK